MHGRCGRRRKAAAAEAAQADADAAAKAQADTAATGGVEDAARQQILQLITPLRSAPPAPEFLAPAGGAGDEQPVMEREGGDAVLPEMEAPPQPPTADAQGSQHGFPIGVASRRRTGGGVGSHGPHSSAPPCGESGISAEADGGRERQFVGP